MSHLKALYAGLPDTEAEFVAEGQRVVRQQVFKRLRLLYGWQHMTEDFIGDGYLALATLLHTPGVRNPAGWLTSAVRRHINRATKHKLPSPWPLNDDGEEVLPGPDDHSPIVLQDLGELCGDETDRRIIAGRAAGFSDPELGAQLGMTSQAVGKRRRGMRDDWGAPIVKGSKGGQRGPRCHGALENRPVWGASEPARG